jgi:lysophospholipid acyltransferase (LPLAT)-like uncharacterized protein
VSGAGAKPSTSLEAADSAKVRWIVRVGAFVLRALARTWRIRVIGDEGLNAERAANRPVIFVLWHGQMLPLLYQHRNQAVRVLISEHRDGELIARTAIELGFGTVRGSSTRGAGRALLGLVREVEAGRDIAVTPDGPRGPAKSFAPGALVVAQRTGARIVPVTAFARKAWRLGSWDRFVIPKPFSRVVISYGPMTAVTAADVRDAAREGERITKIMEDAERVAAGA